jgi:hypothetical protein
MARPRALEDLADACGELVRASGFGAAA